MQKLMGLMRRCIEDYHMIEAGDRIGVGVSGGKDSLTLLKLLAGIREYYPKPFTLEAVTVNLGLPDMDYTPVEAFCRSLDIPYTEVSTKIGSIIFDYRKEKNPCSMCAKMRRGALHEALLERGIHKVALGHHFDDAVETFLMSLLFEGRISCFQPVTELDRTGIVQIRPMLYLSEKTVEHFARRMELPVVHNTCPADKHTKRQEVKELVYQLSATYPDLRTRVFGAMQRFPLPAWEPDGAPYHLER
jgi:tRNA 2-thiocytidine biosynthesis protein TtcA